MARRMLLLQVVMKQHNNTRRYNHKGNNTIQCSSVVRHSTTQKLQYTTILRPPFHLLYPPIPTNPSQPPTTPYPH